MKLLLDTHVFLWYISGDRKLPQAFKLAINDFHNDVWLSAASIWEVSIKHSLGKISLPDSPNTYLPLQRERHSIGSLPIDESCVVRLADIPLLHRDPFDRMLICQSLEHSLTLLTVDAAIKQYDVPLLGT